MRLVIGALVLGLCAWQTGTRAQDWRTDPALWTAAAHTSPTVARAALNAAVAYSRVGQWDEGRAWLMRAIVRADLERDPIRRAWIQRHLCRAVRHFQVLDPVEVSYSVSCAS